jgi:hypothetical protein
MKLRKFIKETIRECLNENVNNNFLSLTKNDIHNIVSEYEEFDEYQYDNAVNSLINLQKILSSKNNIELYRILDVKSTEKINFNELGKHFTFNPDAFDNVTLFDIGIKPGANLYLVKILSPIKNIDFEKTIEANVNYPFEQEIFLNKLDNVEILEVTNFNNQSLTITSM